MDPDGDLYMLRRSAISAQIFDPFVLRGANIEIPRALADELLNFGYEKNFTTNMVSILKKEPPKAKDEACI